MPKIPKEFSMTDYISQLGKATVTKPEYLMPDLSSFNKHLNDFNLSLGKKKEPGEKPAKVQKLNYSGGNTLDLSFTSKKSASNFTADIPTDLSKAKGSVGENESKPLNLSAG